MFYRRIIVLLSLFVIAAGCNNDEGPVNSSLPNESEVVVKHLEANGDYINSSLSAISAKQIREGQLNGTKQVVLDLRTVCDYNTIGHIEGAVLISLKDIPEYYKNNDLASYDRVIITDWSGQTASYAAAILRMSGYTNVYNMLWGMTSWNKVFDVWSLSTSDSRASQLETIAHEKNPESTLPELHTGQTSAGEIIKARAQELLTTGFESVQISEETLFRDKENYYIIDYANIEAYNAGHIPGAVFYKQQQDIRLAVALKTIPPGKPVAIYCSTGHTSAQLAAYLNLAGYKAKSVLYGRNSFCYSTMIGKKFTQEEVNDFPYIER